MEDVKFAAEMTRTMILIDSLDKIKKFNSIMQKAPLKADIHLDKYIVDAASILGLYSIDTVKPIELRIHGKNDSNVDKILEDLKEFIIGDAPALTDPYEK